MSNNTTEKTKKRGIRLVNLVLIFILFFLLYCYSVSCAVKNETNYNYDKIINEIDDEIVEDTIPSSEEKDVTETSKKEISERVLKVRTLKENVNKDIVRLA